MRVIAGNAKGRRLRVGAGLAVRPTADKVKGALFNILASRFDLHGAVVLDVFAGSGNLGIEALSRGARHVTFVDESPASIRLLRDNLRVCQLEEAARVLRLPATRALALLAREALRFDGVLLDPPYGHGLVDQTLAALAACGIVHPGGWVAAEHHVDEAPAAAYGALRLTHARRYGKTALALFVALEAASAERPCNGEHHAPEREVATVRQRAASRPPEGSCRGRAPRRRSPKDDAQMTRAVYAGSFDPITNGHLDVIRRAIEVFDQVIVAVASNTSDPQKDRALFTADERVAMIQESLADTAGRATADRFSGLLVDYCERIGARVIIRGLRAVSDFEYEFQMAMMNRHLKPHVETFFMTAGENYFYTASRLVKEVARLGGDVSGLLPDPVLQRLKAKLQIA
jgi:pantetheine-phosphate adenylyltransferase